MIRKTITAATAAAIILSGAGISLAATRTAVSTPGAHGCVYTKNNRALQHVYSNPANGTTCPAGTFAVSLGGTQGPPGPAGPAGPSGITATATASLVTPPDDVTVITGGSFTALSTQIGSPLHLAAGTYLITFNAKAAADAPGTAQVFPQFFIYNQVKNASFDGDLMNVGTGALEPDGTGHDSYFSGTGQVTIPAGGGSLLVYAFGYDSDSGASSYDLESATLTATELTTS